MEDVKKSLVLNFLIFILVLFGVVFMFLGIRFMNVGIVLSINGLEALKFFTVDSNIFVGVSSILFFVYEFLFIKKKINIIPKFVYHFKYVATVSVMLTFIVTAFFLVPTSKYNWLAFYSNSNLFFHLIVPIFSLISFCFYEKTDFIGFKHVFLSLIPIITYGIFYTISVLSHLYGGAVSFKYDFYGFLRFGVDSMFLVIFLVLILSLVLGFIVRKLNKKQYMG